MGFDSLLLVMRLLYVILPLETYRGIRMLANQIVKLRKKAGISQLKLAEKLNVGPSTIGMYEQGRRIPALDMLVQMAKLFDVSLDYLVTGREMSNFAADKIDRATQTVCPCRACCLCCMRSVQIITGFMLCTVGRISSNHTLKHKKWNKNILPIPK